MDGLTYVQMPSTSLVITRFAFGQRGIHFAQFARALGQRARPAVDEGRHCVGVAARKQ
jgi:hypothetical protein